MGNDIDPLDDFERRTFTAEGVTKPILRSGSGPACIIFAEIPGITPAVASFARDVRSLGCTVVMPVLFGEPGRPPSAGYLAKSSSWACVQREFAAFALHRTAPINVWNIALSRSLHAECGGPGVAVVGMCFTGGFALAMTIDESVVAPVLSQPSLPLPLTKARHAALPISHEDLDRVKVRAEAGCSVLGLRFTGDHFVGTRFDTLRRVLGDHFIAVEIDSSKGNVDGNSTNAHSVLTEHLRGGPDHPTRKAYAQVLSFIGDRLGLSTRS